MDPFTLSLDTLVVWSLLFLGIALVALVTAAIMLFPQVNRTLSAYEKLACTLETELTPTIREVNRLASGVLKLQTVAQQNITEMGTKVEDVTGNITKVADQAKKETSVWGVGLLAGVKSYLEGKKDEKDKRDHSRDKQASESKKIAMDPR